MKFNTKPKCIYIKNIYIQPTKYQKFNNSANVLMENKKLVSDYNANNQTTNNISKQMPKTSIKTYYQNIYPKNPNDLYKENPNYSSLKDVSYKTSYRNEKDHIISAETYKGSVISGRKTDQKNYEIANPFKERSNSENSINCFNRTYSFFNKDNSKTNITTKKVENDFLSNLSYKNNITFAINPQKMSNEINKEKSSDNYISYSNKNSSCSCKISRTGSKKYFYQDQTFRKDAKNDKSNDNDKINDQRIFFSTFQKNQFLSPNSNINNNISQTIIPNSYTEQINKNKFNKNAKRIQKYILSDKKRKMKSRQNFREYKNPLSKSTCIDLNDNNYYKKNTPSRNGIEDIYSKNKNPTNTPSIISNDSIFNNNDNKNFEWIREDKELYINNLNNNNFENELNTSNYYDSNSIIDGYYKDYDKIKLKEMKDKVFAQSAIIIQSVFRGFLVKNKLDTFLYNYKNYYKAMELLEKLFDLYLRKNTGLEKEKLLNFLKEKQKEKEKTFGNKSNINFKSCKAFKLFNIPYTPHNDSGESLYTNKFIDLFLHEEIGERFNIIKKNINKEKELEKKHKEELENVNNKMNKLIEENNMLKDMNQKSKLRDDKFKEITMENKKKDNIINIITNDNQNLAKKLKIIQDKYNKLFIEKQIHLNIELNKNKSEYKNSKELIEDIKKLNLLFLFYKKNSYLSDILRKNFDKYKNIITIIKDKKNTNNSIRKLKLNYIMTNQKSKTNNNTYINFIKLYYTDLLKNKENENKNNIIKEKLMNIISKKEKAYKLVINSYFNRFYYNGVISSLIEEKNECLAKEKIKKLNNLKKYIISIENLKKNYYIFKYRNCFNRWNLLSKMLSMKAVTDEKKRKKRQKQRTKKKLEKNKSANKYLSNSNSNSNIHNEKNNINTYNKEKDKDIINYLEHSVTTDFSGVEIIMDNKTDKIMKATEKLSGIFYKAALYYKLIDNNNKNNNNIDSNTNNQNISKNNSDKKDVKDDNGNDNDDEDSGESSFGI